MYNKSHEPTRAVGTHESWKLSLTTQLYSGQLWSLAASFHSHALSMSQAQNKRTQERMSTALASDMASADSVLTATFWILREAQMIGLTGPSWLLAMFLWLAMIKRP